MININYTLKHIQIPTLIEYKQYMWTTLGYTFVLVYRELLQHN
jgi:hypothetical protein